ncbi:cysteine hydrolase [Tardisphaera miroshnichenkoae]
MVILELRDFLKRENTVLVVWDVQKGLVQRIFNREEFMANLSTVLEGARKVGIPVIFTKITPLPPKYESRARRAFSGGRGGFNPSDLDLAVDVKEGEYVLSKNFASLFVGTPVEQMLRNAGIETVLLTGISTDVGIIATAWDALNRGFFPIVLSDVVSSPDKGAHEEALDVMSKHMAVLTSREVLAALEAVRKPYTGITALYRERWRSR